MQYFGLEFLRICVNLADLSMDWIELAQIRIQELAFVNTVMNLLSHKGKEFLNQLNNYQLHTTVSSLQRAENCILGGNFYISKTQP
jgi:hypothetical protein